MEKIILPDKFEVKKISEDHAEIIIEPCYPGYGTTLGNALRRVLLSSLSGAAITAVKIKGITHEFSTLPGVKEDLVEIILNLKKLRFKLHDVDETSVTLKVKGEKKVKAKDIKLTSEVEAMNPEADIAILNEKNSELEMEIFIKSGRGYLPVENIEKKKFELGTIAVDAIFTPIKNVNFNVENVRVGQMTNYDRLIMNIATDNTISPEQALKDAANILVNHFAQICSVGQPEPKETNSPSKDEKIKPKEKSAEEETEMTKTKRKKGRPKKE